MLVYTYSSMILKTLSLRQFVGNIFLQETIIKSDFERFRQRLVQLLNYTDDATEAGETEEHNKNFIPPFLQETNFGEEYLVNTKGRQDLAIHNGKTRNSSVGVIIKTKWPCNMGQMISVASPNRKALQEAILYYLRERIEQKNEDITYINATDSYRCFIFDARDFERYFYDSKQLREWYDKCKQDLRVSSRTQFIYKYLSTFINGLDATLKAGYLNLNNYRSLLEKKIDELDYELYGLTDEEIDIVENSVGGN